MLSQDGHVEVARLLLDSGAQVNMPADSFESPLTLAACGGHVELAALLIERGANLEEVNDEGYTPLMEAAREGHEEMVALLLAQGELLLLLCRCTLTLSRPMSSGRSWLATREVTTIGKTLLHISISLSNLHKMISAVNDNTCD